MSMKYFVKIRGTEADILHKPLQASGGELEYASKVEPHFLKYLYLAPTL
ncbi:hypothetical protein EYZ11_004869 [Aspergillus tanneri]|uniref:Uncharacterized protein n=1 Tax=Aspergillus tanneri TaxID=1220188 RepID=A0A4S3JJG2_9EURO|nr:hypothetical protein EYZ11_004869 [Aspergillus tanneri]